MESEESNKERSKKVWGMLRIALLMMGRSIFQTHLHLRKRSKIASKAILNLISKQHYDHQYYSTLTCRSTTNIHTNSYISPQVHRRHYEFSCSNTPHHHSKRNNHHQYQDIKALDVHVATEINELKHPQEDHHTWSPSPQVDKDAEEFINQFYRDLMNQKRMAAMESPSPCHMWPTR